MLNFIRGAQVPNAQMLEEGYKPFGNRIEANVNAEKIKQVIYNFIEINDQDPLFLFIEAASNLKDERVLKKPTDTDMGLIEETHNDVYYLDGLSAKAIRKVLEPFCEILIHDGMTVFGVGSNKTGDEIGKYRYNIMRLYSSERLQQYNKIFEKENIIQKSTLITAWNIIDKNNPGYSTIYKANGRDIYDVIEALKSIGLYKAGQRESE